MPRKPAAGRPRSCGPWPKKHSDVAKLLIEHGADVHTRTKHFVFPGSSGYHYNAGYEGDFGQRARGARTPLMFAAEHGDVDCARVLVAAGAEVNAATPEASLLLVVASANAQEDSLNSCWIRARIRTPPMTTESPLYTGPCCGGL